MAAGTSHTSHAPKSSEAFVDGSHGGPLALAYAGPEDDRLADAAARMAWWVGLTWCAGTLIIHGHRAYWAAIDLTAGLSPAHYRFDAHLSRWQTLALVFATTPLLLSLVLRGSTPSWSRTRVILAVLAALIVLAPMLRAIFSQNLEYWSELSFRLSYGFLYQLSPSAGVLLVAWYAIAPQSATARRLCVAAALVLIVEPLSQLFIAVGMWLVPGRPDSVWLYLLRPAYLFNYASAAIHLLAAVVALVALRKTSPPMWALYAAALAIPLAVILVEVPVQLSYWRSLHVWGFLGRTLVMASPMVALLLWPRDSQRGAKLRPAAALHPANAGDRHRGG